MPGFTGVALNVICSPIQTPEEGSATILMLAGRDDTTVIVNAFEVAGLPVAHVLDEVITHVTTSPVTSEEDE